MNKLKTLRSIPVFTLFLLLALVQGSYAQRNVIKFDPKNCGQFTHGLGEVIVLDQRPDTLGTIGYVKLGLGNRPVKVETDGPLSQEIRDYYQAVSAKATAGGYNGLVVVIHDMMATEDGMGLTKEFAFFRYRAEYFTGGQDSYRSIGMIDTTVEISAGDVTAKLMRKIDECLCSFCQHLLDKQPSGTGLPYTLADVRNIEAVRRLEMPAYKAKSFPDGIYATWEDFLQLRSTEGKKLLEYKKNTFTAQGISKKGKPYKYHIVSMDPDRRINPGRIIVFQGVPYKTFEGRFLPMSFADDHQFHFTGRTTRYNPGSGNVFPMVAGGAVGGAIGAGIAVAISGGGKAQEFDFTINWRTGKVVPGRQINPPKTKRKK